MASLLAGLIGKTGDVIGITTAYAITQVILLDGSFADEKRAGAMPSDADLGSLEVEVAVTAGVPTQLFCYFTYDAEGDYFASAVGTISLIAALTTAARMGGSVVFDAPKIASVQRSTTPGGLYLWMKTDVGTVTFKSARLGWRLGGK